MFTNKTLLVLVAGLSSMVLGQDPTDAIDCSDDAHIIAARGTTKDCDHTDNIDGLSQVIDYVQQHHKQGKVSVEGLDYPASGNPQCTIQGYPDYKESRRQGEETLTTLIQQRVDKCGDKSNIVLIGFSQGAQVITDLISGGANTKVPALDTKYTSQLSAVVLIANPAQQSGAPYNNKQDKPAPNPAKAAPEGPKTTVGFGDAFIIPNPRKVDALKDRVIAYCEQGDKFCDHPGAPGKKGQMIHGMEIKTWATLAGQFIVDKI